MRIKIDFDNKVISLEDKTNLGELVNQLNLLFPKNEWKKFTLETNVTINWINPITINPIPFVPYYQPQPYFYQDTHKITCDSDGFPKGSYCLELKN